MRKLLIFLALFLLGALILFFLIPFENQSPFSAIIVLFFCLAGLYFMGHPVLKRYAFTIWVFAAVSASLAYPAAFDEWFNMDLAILIVPLIQIIMFGMGTTLNLDDFKRVFQMPGPVLIGIFLQFLIMPSVAVLLVYSFGFEPEIAAGVILIGSCPGGVASNLMAYLARGNVALSVTMTSCSTLLSPLMTPLLMKTLAGRFVPIHFLEMMFSILNMIIVPILAGLVANTILYGSKKWVSNKIMLIGIAAISFMLTMLSMNLDAALLGQFAAVKGGLIIGFILIGVVSLSKLIISILLNGPVNWMDKVLPVISMAAICYIIAIITARSSDKLLTMGVLLLLASLIHNFAGYTLGYFGSKLIRLKEKDCRTVAFEVGMQNGGMASGLAMTVLKSPLAALPPAIFGPLMNVTGSMLATWWKGKPD